MSSHKKKAKGQVGGNGQGGPHSLCPPDSLRVIGLDLGTLQSQDSRQDQELAACLPLAKPTTAAVGPFECSEQRL